MRYSGRLFAGVLMFAAACGGKVPGTVDQGQDEGGSASSSSGSSSGGDGGASSSSSSGSSSGGSPSPACAPDATLNCLGTNPSGYACVGGDNPQVEDPGLSCSGSPVGANFYCCFSGFVGSPTTCEPADNLASCPFNNAYGYQCDAASTPMSSNPSLDLNCPSPPVRDPDGVHFDYCCYPP